ncbi:hypothetical protein HYN69_01795 [Gemmobacter aquarius]|uniref:SH3b domain-containing protein n=1 Tax=Paragemmobacter aquarius TaxID=2169400 RepID=A0A2S0UHU8_9RHOB|nr:SH3 domain-containing protein [Gemmobacter aquarius]AWB47407.1 hypothetical protein HYN69_01795 [Gemmobacter aquarius]
MFRLLVLLCASLYSSMVIFGDGPARTARFAVEQASDAPAISGIRVLPAPKPVVRATAPQEVSLAAYTPTAPSQATPDTLTDTLTDSALSADANLPANVQLRWITAGTANVRSEPNKRSALAGKVGLGEAVYLMWAEPNGWMRVRSATGDVTGFVHKSLLTDQAPATATVDLATAD